MTEHRLTTGRTALGRQAYGNLRGAAGIRYGTTARCSCGEWSWRRNVAPSAGGTREAAREFARHVAGEA